MTNTPCDCDNPDPQHHVLVDLRTMTAVCASWMECDFCGAVVTIEQAELDTMLADDTELE